MSELEQNMIKFQELVLRLQFLNKELKYLIERKCNCEEV